MRFPKIVFWVAGVWGVLILTPLYFMFDLIGRQDPPAITHPGFYYGFAGAGLAWQIAFLIIATDPQRFRPIMLAAIFEKFAYGMAMTLLFVEHRIHPADLAFAEIDLTFGVLFIAAFVRLGGRSKEQLP